MSRSISKKGGGSFRNAGLLVLALTLAGAGFYMKYEEGGNADVDIVVDTDVAAPVVEAPIEAPVEVAITPPKPTLHKATGITETPTREPIKQTASEELEKLIEAEAQVTLPQKWARAAGEFFLQAKQAVLESPAKHVLSVPAKWWHVSTVILSYSIYRVSKARRSTVSV